MSGVRVLVGTRKGAFVLSSDAKRQRWDISGPHFAGWEIYHLKGSPADPNRLYASQSSGWFGQIIQRSSDGGNTWEVPGGEKMPEPYDPPVGGSNKFVYDTSPETGKPLTTHQWYDGTPHPWEFKRVWHLEPSLTDPDTVYAGVEDAALFRSTDGAQTWHELAGLRGHGSGSSWQPGAGGMCLHTILIDPTNHHRMFIAISSAGAFRSDDGAKTWTAINRGLRSQHIPDPDAEVGHCVHRIAMHPSRPNVLFMQKHWDVMRSDNAGDEWREVSGNLPTDFGFCIERTRDLVQRLEEGGWSCRKAAPGERSVPTIPALAPSGQEAMPEAERRRLDQALARDLQRLAELSSAKARFEVAGARLGDLDQDGDADAAVLLDYLSDGPASAQFLMAYQYDGETFRPAAKTYLGRLGAEARVSGIERIDEGVIEVVLQVRQQGDQECCPSGRHRQAYVLQDGNLVELRPGS